MMRSGLLFVISFILAAIISTHHAAAQDNFTTTSTVAPPVTAAPPTATPAPAVTYAPVTPAPLTAAPTTGINLLQQSQVLPNGVSLALPLFRRSGRVYAAFASSVAMTTGVTFAMVDPAKHSVTPIAAGTVHSNYDAKRWLGVYAGVHAPSSGSVFLCLSSWIGMESNVSSRIVKVTIPVENVPFASEVFYTTGDKGIASCALNDPFIKTSYFCFGSKVFAFDMDDDHDSDVKSASAPVPTIYDLSIFLGAGRITSASLFITNTMLVMGECYAPSCTLYLVDLSLGKALGNVTLPGANYGRGKIVVENPEKWWVLLSGGIFRLEWLKNKLVVTGSFMAPSISAATLSATANYIYFRTTGSPGQIARIHKDRMSFDSATTGWSSWPLGQYGDSFPAVYDSVIFTNGGTQTQLGYAYLLGTGPYVQPPQPSATPTPFGPSPSPTSSPHRGPTTAAPSATSTTKFRLVYAGAHFADAVSTPEALHAKLVPLLSAHGFNKSDASLVEVSVIKTDTKSSPEKSLTVEFELKPKSSSSSSSSSFLLSSSIDAAAAAAVSQAEKILVDTPASDVAKAFGASSFVVEKSAATTTPAPPASSAVPGALIGGIVGGVSVIIIFVAVFIFCHKKKKESAYDVERAELRTEPHDGARYDAVNGEDQNAYISRV